MLCNTSKSKVCYNLIVNGGDQLGTSVLLCSVQLLVLHGCVRVPGSHNEKEHMTVVPWMTCEDSPSLLRQFCVLQAIKSMHVLVLFPGLYTSIKLVPIRGTNKIHVPKMKTCS